MSEIRNQLIEILKVPIHPHLDADPAEVVADYLIANGVTMQRWISVTERLPENEGDVFVLAQRSHWCEDRTFSVIAMGFYTDGKHNTEESNYVWEDLEEYIEELDAYLIPEGWWERVVYGEEFSAIYDKVTHWMPLPQPPKEDS